MVLMRNYWNLNLVHWADWIGDDLPDRERQSIDLNIEGRLANPVYLKLYERDRTYVEQHPNPEHPLKSMFQYADNLMASRAAEAEKLQKAARPY
jgi:hypothetical protein